MVQYRNTNETIEAIISGMDLKPTDRVLSICGSGDQPLAMLEYASHVTAIDVNLKQLKYARKQIRKLMREDYVLFKYKKPKPITLLKSLLSGVLEPNFLLSPEEHTWLANIGYFSKQGRLEAIREKLGQIDFIEGDIFSVEFKPDSFDKVYLSNAYGYLGYRGELAKILKATRKDGLLYFIHCIFPGNHSRYHRVIKMDEELTRKAVKISSEQTRCGYWAPTVYRKMS